ncbi:MAG: DUF4433 domain-containing protein [bacterium]|nr:DUF4433 domain-containing protein [bacterium]
MWPFGKADIAHELKRRKIDLLLHSTHVSINLPQIFEDGFIDTARGLRSRLGAKAERLLHDPRRLEKFVVGLDYINCSITTPNFELLYARSKSAWQTEWVHFVLDTKLLEHPDTLFCPVSAAQDYGQHVQYGIAGLQSMFAEQVETWTRTGLHKSEPTHPQAEALVKSRLSLDNVTEILTANGQVATEVERLTAFYHRNVRVKIGPKLFLWPKRLKKKA